MLNPFEALISFPLKKNAAETIEPHYTWLFLSKGFAMPSTAPPIERSDRCQATLLPYPTAPGVRPEALRPTLSSGLLLSSNHF
jgi:hypothetical protein